MSPDRHWIAPALYMAMIIALSSIPGSTGAQPPSGPVGWLSPIVSNALHVPLYAGLGFVWAYALAPAGRMPPPQVALAAFVIATVFGGIDELYQGLIPGRTTALGDWLADGAGAAIGCILFLSRHHYSRQQE